MPRVEIDDVSSLPDPVKKLFAKDDSGKFVLDTDSSSEALEGTLRKEREQRKALEKALKRFEGIEDPDAARDALSKFSEVNGEATKTKAEAAKFQKQLEDSRREAADLRQRYQASMLRNAENDAIKEAGVDALPGLEFFLREQLRVVDEDGTPAVRVVDSAGNVRTSKKGDPIHPREIVQEMAKDPKFGHLFRGNQAVGAGVRGSDGRAAVADNPFNKKSPNVTKQMELMRSNPDLAARLQAEAAALG